MSPAAGVAIAEYPVADVPYAILFAAMAKKQRIFLAGIDGYEDDKFKRKDVQLILDQIQSKFNIKIKSLTKNYKTNKSNQIKS